jgi:hypothetical protein
MELEADKRRFDQFTNHLKKRSLKVKKEAESK